MKPVVKAVAFIYIFTLILSLLGVALSADGADEIDTYSEAYVVMDAKTGQVLLQKNMNKREYPASITKVLTLALAAEKGDFDEMVTMQHDSVYSIGRGTTHIALSEGEVISLKDLVYSMHIESANDSANGVAQAVGGSLEGFAEMMNQKAQEIGAYNSHFVNAHGLDNKDHYTTAYDMALITKYGLSVRGFREVFGATEYSIAPTNKQPKQRNFGTYHHMLVNSSYQYEGAWGGKLGWTTEARHTAVTVAKRGDVELICVVMNSKNKWDKYKDTAKLFDYCFENYSYTELDYGEKVREIPILSGDVVTGTMRAEYPAKLQLLVKQGINENHLTINDKTPADYDEKDIEAPQLEVVYSENGKDTVLYSYKVNFETDMASQTAMNRVESEKHEKGLTLAQKFSFAVVGLLVLAVVVFVVLVVARVIISAFYRAKKQRAHKEASGKRNYD